MRPLTDFGTDKWPLHPSFLNTLMVCPWRAAVHFLTEPRDEGGPAGDTGSALHKAIEAFHKGSDTAESIAVMQAGKAKYPLADLNDAAAMFLSYIADARNRTAKVILVEQPIKFSISPAPWDCTQAPIEVEGMVDQVREDDYGPFVYDVKSSKKDPIQVMNECTFQQAGYAVGASILLGRPVRGAKLIMTRKYAGQDPSTAKVFWQYAWTFEDLEHILEGIRHRVADVRAGRLYHAPNADCRWCPMRTPDLCLPELIKLRAKL